MPYLLQTSCASHSEPQGAVKQSNIQRDFSKSQTQYAVCIVQSHILNMAVAILQGSGATAFLLFVLQFLPPGIKGLQEGQRQRYKVGNFI